MTGEQIEKYIREELNSEPRHNCIALAEAINHVSNEVEYDPFALMQLLLENKPIDALHTQRSTILCRLKIIIMKDNKLLDVVDDAFNYFNGFRLEELKGDDKFYINALMTYVEQLESRTKQLKDQVINLKSTIK
jgi:hypothetical protein